MLDAWLQAAGQPLAGFLRDPRPGPGRGLGEIAESLPELLDAVAGYLDQGTCGSS